MYKIYYSNYQGPYINPLSPGSREFIGGQSNVITLGSCGECGSNGVDSSSRIHVAFRVYKAYIGYERSLHQSPFRDLWRTLYLATSQPRNLHPGQPVPPPPPPPKKKNKGATHPLGFRDPSGQIRGHHETLNLELLKRCKSGNPKPKLLKHTRI